ncbi:MAG: beta-lactamase domain protein [Candidatus Aminicenantes bacterium]|jgi:7,8-dihydropterin-6-yl-methyl-4-(beta-D-ribofuranosyl)aminobenzene 5'-phosphate synthase|nr:beta-lactamase domain protein [Candidatus Aminicenantes bacterium]
MKRSSVFLMGLAFSALVLSSGAGLPAQAASVQAEARPISITILYDNYPFQEGLKTGHGFSCLIQGTEKAVLFDTGADAETLFHNFAALQLDPARVDLVVISHTHGDHTGGLLPFLARKGQCQVFLPASASPGLVGQIEAAKGKAVLVKEPLSVCEGVFSTGPIQEEQALVVDTPRGLVIITGCAHPGIVQVVEKAASVMPKEIYLVMGGFHLAGRPQSDLELISRRLRELGVENLGASHCTGDKAIELFKKDFGKNYIPLGVGKEIVIR